ncbi:L-histidine N(alpha)-methyltransferase [Notoacmeibacter ruber]|uniref:L-histidine N(Alpha)-methyltransferase n=1 Tax=Notoacmeibacter ruber TaxID=2670375 RepID=A0A3L7J9D1_9HYPH|nr:L-histidine N(alpha)-methyltransferase [Notoacmeibacter ruber]RLQ87348.1 L-histidine N(alpha)-methyltransferase [Notoacmeibacter ruber]
MLDRTDPTFRESVLKGLAKDPKVLEPKWFYDAAGSALFDEICELPEYYPTRTEKSILEERAAEIASELGNDVILYEPGAGSLQKARILLEALEGLARFIPSDISAAHLEAAASDLRKAFPDIAIDPVACDFTKHLEMPAIADDRPVTIFFPGSTIGNFEPGQAENLLRRFRKETGARQLLIGVDLVKDRETLVAAYDDAAGVTAAFNLNLLKRINRELEADFALHQFQHHALFNESRSRIEMHLESLCEQSVSISGERFDFRDGERIHTENSYKYTPERFASLAGKAGWVKPHLWTDQNRLFGVFLFQSEEAD